ncbi:MAG: hypothetical protein IJF92_03810 [Bacilli bacterium]|nr:hypothetical protein [Bacilli bacterium]
MHRKEKKAILGDRNSGVFHYILAFIINAIIHLCIFVLGDFKYYDIVHFVISYIFFMYPVTFVIDVIWSLRPSVSRILNSEYKMNRKYYMNIPKKDYDISKFKEVTVSIPVYLEENSVIFQTITDSLEAVKEYNRISGKYCNIVVSDDGIGAILKEKCNRRDIDNLILQYKNNKSSLSNDLITVAERIIFYRNYNVAFVARPKENRIGLFKKASNLNYTLTLGDELEKGKSLEELTKKDGEYEGGYAEGDIKTYEIILLLDKDSGVNKNIIEAIMPEFIDNEKLSYVQCATNAINMDDNFFANTMGVHVNNLFHNIWPCNALKGFFAPLVGHNAFLRKSALREIGYWDSTKVSEDYDAAIKLYSQGYYGKYAQIKGLEFTEYASRTYTEEAGKQYRYTYGLFEMMFDGTIKYGKARKGDIFYMVIYFLSKVYIVTTIPYALFVTYAGDINIMWAGFILCQAAFMFLPVLRYIILRGRFKKEYLLSLPKSIILSISYLGYSYSSLLGAIKYVLNKFKKANKTFPASSVGTLNYCFSEGVIILNDYITNNMSFLIIAVLCADRIVNIMTRHYALFLTKATCSYILLGIVIMPIILTPHLYHVKFNNKGVFKKVNMFPLIALVSILIFIPIISYNYYKTQDYGDTFLNNTNSISLMEPANDFPYMIKDIEPGKTREVHFEVKNFKGNKKLKNKTNYSIAIGQGKLPFKYKLKCMNADGKCIRGNDLKPNTYYSDGVMSNEGKSYHNYTLYVTWESKHSKYKIIRNIKNALEMFKYNLFTRARINIKVRTNNYIYDVSNIKNEEYIRNSDNLVELTIKADKRLFNGINLFIDGDVVDSNNYSVFSNKITLKKNYLNKLEDGKHKVKIILPNNGQANTSFTITKE